MISHLFTLIVGTLADFLSLTLLARFTMQWTRAPFQNPIGQFVLAVTDWAVRPARKLVPGLFGLDIASLLLAWLVQSIYLSIVVGITGMFATASGSAMGTTLVAALVETLRLAVQLASGIVIVAVIMSWVNPYTPLGPLFAQLADPLLRPVRRMIPPVGGIDLSPLVVLLGLQAVLVVLGHWRGALLPFFAT
jgi:YggT family protein